MLKHRVIGEVVQAVISTRAREQGGIVMSAQVEVPKSHSNRIHTCLHVMQARTFTNDASYERRTNLHGGTG